MIRGLRFVGLLCACALLNAAMVHTAAAEAGGNVALASAGAVASASSTYGPGYPVSAVNNDERTGAGWGSGGGWADGTLNSWPDSVQIVFNGSKTIDRVVVYTVQDNYTNPSEPSDSLTFNDWGNTAFTVEGWTGSAWVVLGTVTGNNLVKRTVTFAPFTTDRIRITVTAARNAWSLLTEVEAWEVAAGSSNVALASAGAVASASSTYGPGYPVSAVNNNERTGAGWGSGGGWADGTPGSFPDSAQIVFNGSQTIDRVVVYTVQDNYTNPSEPSDSLTFNDWGNTHFTVEGWSGSAWVVLGTVTGNNLVKRTVTFSPFTTDRIRINVTAARSSWALITEVEAWSTSGSGLPPTTTVLSSSANPAAPGSPITFTATVTGNNPAGTVTFVADGGPSIPSCSAVGFSGGSGNTRTAACTVSNLAVGPHTIVASYAGDNSPSSSAPLSQMITAAGSGSNVALASAGAVASASSTYGPGYPVSAVNNDERTGAGWGNGGGWADGTLNSWPDSVQIVFNGSKTIDRVVVYTVQDNYTNPSEPSDSLTFNDWGNTAFTVEGWTGSAWVVLGTVTGNNLVKRTVTFAPFTTDRIRINVTAARNSWSLITEVEAWGVSASTSTPGPSEPAMIVRMTDAPTFPGDVDGPNWEFANKPMFAWWVHPGGDWRDAADVPQGNAHYAMSADIGAPGDVALSVTALVARLLTSNTGMYVSTTKGIIKIASRTHAALPGPRLHIVTTTGVFDPPCTIDTFLSPSSDHPLGGQETFEFPAILKFDLSAVTGTVTAATLTLGVSTVYVVPAQLVANYLDPPTLNLTTTGSVMGNRAQGIAATVAQDNALATHPSVLVYDDLISKEYIRSNFQGVAGEGSGQGPPNLANNAEIVQWPQYGLSAARVWSITTNQRLVSWHHWAEPKQNPPKAWQRDFGNGHTHLFFRYLMEIGTDVKVGMTEFGMKLPGLAGTYDFSNSGAVTLPQPANDGTWEMRLWHTGLSPRANPDIYHLATYYYGVEHPFSLFSGNGETRFTKGFMKAGRVYSIEQEIKLNTLTNGVANADGIERVWLDGVLMYENTATRIRGYDHVRIQSIPWVNIYHGGLGMPAAPFHYDIGGIVVATEYIGPPKLLTGSQ